MPNVNDDLNVYGNLYVRGASTFVDTATSLLALQVSDLQATPTFPGLIAGNPDPTVGRAAPIGTLYLRTTTPSELWQKTGPTNIDWTMIAGAGAALSGATLTITGAISPAAIGPGNVNNYNPAGLATASILRQAVNVAGANLSGIAAQPIGRFLVVENFGSGVLTLIHEGGGSTAANRLQLPGDVNWQLPVDGSALFFYDASLRWRMVATGTNVFPFVEIAPAAASPATNNGQVLVWGGNPNGSLTALDGSLCLDTATPALWLNLDGATRWVQVGANPTINDGMALADDFLTTVMSLSTVAGGGTNTFGGTFVTAARPGQVRQSVTSTATPDRAVLTAGGTGCYLLGGGVLTYQVAVAPQNLQDATDRWSWRAGLGDVTTASAPSDGVFFEQDLAVNGSNNWFAVTIAGGVATRTDCGVAPSAGSFDTLMFVTNAAATSIGFFVNGTLRATITTNIPTGATQQTGLTFLQLVKTLGAANARTMTVDFYSAVQYLTTRR